MKSRKGFVSNSSSSSFIVAFPKKPDNAEELQKMLFGDDQYFNSPYSDNKWTSLEIAKIVFNDMKTPATVQEMINAISGGWYDEQPEFKDFKDKEGEIDWRAYERGNNKAAAKVLKQFMKENPGKEFYTFSYSDEDGNLYSAMEHGNLFINLEHKQISHH